MCSIDSDVPLVYDIVTGSSNGDHYINFWMQSAWDSLFPGDVVLVDCASFHAKGFSATTVQSFLEQLGVHYILLPKYSPELNPVELVFSMLKRYLNSIKFTKTVMEHIIDGLAIVKTQHVISFYQKRGYI